MYNYKSNASENGITELFGITDSKVLQNVKLSSKINTQRSKINYSTGFSSNSIKEYYSGNNSNLFPDESRKPDFKKYPIHKKIREKMFIKRK